jgi:hypothetical protein
MYTSASWMSLGPWFSTWSREEQSFYSEHLDNATESLTVAKCITLCYLKRHVILEEKLVTLSIFIFYPSRRRTLKILKMDSPL